MLRGLATALVKDLRLLARDRAALIFLTIAPIVVITVAGFSLASLYGADPRGATAYLLPLVDEDQGEIGPEIRRRLETENAVELRVLERRDEALRLLHAREAGAALIIPPGASQAVAEGRSAELLLYTDPVKYLEIANVRALVQEIRHGLESAARDRAVKRVEEGRGEALAGREDLMRKTREAVEAVRERLAGLRGEIERRMDAARERAQRDMQARAAEHESAVRERLATELEPLRAFLRDLDIYRAAFEDWVGAVREKAGKYADKLPPPPTPPSLPSTLQSLAGGGVGPLIDRLLASGDARSMPPPMPKVELPALADFPSPRFPEIPEPQALSLPGTLELREESVTGAPLRLNTFDQNVPGFSVTFLLLGMLLGVSLGLLDERDWGTFARLRAMPTPFAATLLAKLGARFLVGVVQMIALFAVGRIAFGVSLGPQPWALLLPIAGIVFAGTAFGLVVAGVARSREAVLPIGSIVIVTMAAVGGCWWPIDLEPRWMRAGALAFPTTWAMAAFNDLMIRRQTVEAAVRPAAVLLAYGGIYLAAGLFLFRRQT